MPKEKTEKNGKKTENDNLVESLAESINKASSKDLGYDVINFLDESDYYAKINDWVSTGVDTLDIAMSNRPHAGCPVGRIVEFNGLESSGKSLVCAHILAETQKKGGIAVFIDTENAVSEDFMQAIGVELTGPNKLVYIQLETIEQIFKTILNIIETVRKSTKHKDRIITIVVDSVAGATTENELSGGFDKQGYNTHKAILLSSYMRQLTNLFGREKILIVFTNQLREKLGVMFGEKYTTSGGKAIPFHASLRIRLAQVGKIKKEIDGVTKVVGMEIEAKVIKSKLGTPHKSTKFKMYFDSGIDNVESFLGELKRYKIVDGNEKSGYKFKDETDNTYSFTLKELREMFLDKDNIIKNKLYDKLVSKVVEKYNFQKTGEEDAGIVVVEDEED
jgi:recombination protein RecA